VTHITSDPVGDGLGLVLDNLAADLGGTLVRRGDVGWDAARQAWNLSADQQPHAVVLAASARDVQATVRAARSLGLRVAPQSTGHNALPLGDLSDSLLLKLNALRDVKVDPAAGVARVGGGATWRDVVPLAAASGFATLAGTAADVGVAGYTLGGGLSWLARQHGLTSNSVVALEVVTADGQLRRVDDDHDPELFWALRGGGGSFGIVTALEFRLVSVSHVHAGAMFFPVARAEEVLQAWREWLPALPDSVSSIGRLLKFPPLPELPPDLSGQAFVLIEAVCLMDAATSDDLLAPLRVLGPAIDTFTQTPVEELAALHMDPPAPVPAYGDGLLLADLTAEAVSAFARFAAADVPLLSLELRHLGGALTPGRVDAGAVDGVPGAVALYAVGMTPDEALAQVVRDALSDVERALAPWANGLTLLNFAERSRSGSAFYDADTYRRLQAVKAAYDPQDLIRANHPVAPA
jgi:FAD/FMN-containing dehydrogenase